MSMRYPGGLIAPTPVNQQYPSGVWTGPQSAPYQANNVWGNDSSFKNTTLLLHGDGATRSFTQDASTNNFQITLNGDTKPNNLTPFITNGYWSNYFDGSGDYLSVSSNTAFDFAGDFTVEGYFYFLQVNQVAGATVLFNTNVLDRFQLAIENNVITLRISGSLVINTAYTSASLLNTWTHIAAVRTGSTVAVFVNGTRLATGTSSATPDNSVAYIGVQTPGYSNHYFNGYLSSLRVVNGSGPYNATQTTLTVPTSPLTAITNTSLLTCQSNRFVDNSTNALAITVAGDTAVSMQQPFTAPSGTSLFGSGYFDGSGDYLRSPTGYLTGVTTGNFTVEGWWNFGDFTTRTTYFQRLWSFGTGLANDVTLNVDNSGNLVFRVNDSIIASQSSGAMKLNSWNHVALVRSSGTVTIYLNGTSVASAANSSNISGQAGNSFYIGCESDGAGGYFYGYCSNVRISNTAVYTTTFTPSTTPLTVTSGTSLLTLQTNGPATNSGFLDSSYNSFPITRNGNTTQGSFNPYQTTGYWSNAFDGSGDYLTIPSSSTFSFTGDFTWEAWVYLPVTTSGAEIVSKHLSGITGWYMLVISGSLTVQFVIWNSSNTSSTATSSSTIKLGQWNHIAGGRYGSTVFACLNGVYTSSALTVTPRTTNNAVNIGANLDGSSNSFNGYISNLRCASYAVYTGNYTVPTAPLTAIANTQLLTCQSNRFKDNSSNNFALTSSGNVSVQNFQPFTLPALQYTPQVFGGSGYFDGSGDYLTLPVNPAFDLGLNACCVEAWVYLTNNNTFGLFATSSNTSGQTRPNFYIAYNQLQIDYFGNAFIQANITVTLNSWHHAVFTRASSSGPWRIFLDGVLQAYNATGNQNLLQTGAAQEVGRLYAGTTGQGYMCDLRIVNGSVPSAYVTSSTTTGTQIFTPPTAPLGVISNTVLLLPYTNAAIFDNSGMNNLETVGNAQIDTSVVKYGASSIYFDGSGDQLYSIANQSTRFGTGDFTIEFWVYGISGSSRQDWLDLYNGTVGNRIQILWVSSQIAYYQNNTFVTGGGVYNTNTWYHIALSRASGSNRLFVNGVQVGTTASNTTNFNANAVYIGKSASGGTDFNGYMDDIRITAGVARYVTNFTPPVARMPNQ